MRCLPTRFAASVVIGALVAGVSTAGQPQTTGACFEVFARRVERYVRMRARFEEQLPPFEKSRRAWSLFLMRRYLASAIRAAQPGVQPGVVFSAPVESIFRERIHAFVVEVDIEGLSGWDTDLDVDIVVREPVPVWMLQLLPPALRDRLPPLPEAVEYRMAAGALVLWDTHAEIVIDVLPEAFVVR